MTRWALVTAGAQGLGGALSRYLLEQGYQVIVHFRSSTRGTEALQHEFGTDRVLPIAADLATRSGQAELIDTVKCHVSRLHVLVNNLGVYPEVDLLDIDIDLWEQSLMLTCTTGFHLIQELHPLMRGEGSRIINIGDAVIDRLEGHAQGTPYYIAKYGMLVLTRSYAPLLMPHGITVNMISPGWLENSIGPTEPALPGGRRGTFEDITGALGYLLSDAAAYVSGANLVVAGGFSAVRVLGFNE